MIDMQDFLYSVNITLPIILVVLLGYLLRKKGLIDGAFVNIGNMLCFKVAFPLLLFQDLASVDLTKEFHLPFLLYCGAVTTVSFAIVWLLARKCIQDKREIGAFVQGSFRGSAALMGIALIQSIYGSAAAAPFMIIGAVPLYNIYSVIVLTVEGNRKDVSMKKRMGEVVLQVLKNPLIIGILLGMLASLLKLDFPAGIEGTIDSLASLATPLALLVLGAGFEGKKAVAKLPLTLWASSIKLVFQGLIFFPFSRFPRVFGPSAGGYRNYAGFPQHSQLIYNGKKHGTGWRFGRQHCSGHIGAVGFYTDDVDFCDENAWNHRLAGFAV